MIERIIFEVDFPQLLSLLVILAAFRGTNLSGLKALNLCPRNGVVDAENLHPFYQTKQGGSAHPSPIMYYRRDGSERMFCNGRFPEYLLSVEKTPDRCVSNGMASDERRVPK